MLWLRTPQDDFIDITLAYLGGDGHLALPFGMDVSPEGYNYHLVYLTPGVYSDVCHIEEEGFHILKYDSDANYISASKLDMDISSGTYGIEIGNLMNSDFNFKIDFNNGKTYLTGTCYGLDGIMYFGGEPLVLMIGSGMDGYSAPSYLVAFESNGDHSWTHQTIGDQPYLATTLYNRPAIDESGNIFIAGGGLSPDEMLGM